MITELFYKDFVWTFKALSKKGLDVMKYYYEGEDFFVLKFFNDGVEYWIKIWKNELAGLVSRFDNSKHKNIQNIPINTNTLNIVSVENFVKDELFDYMKVKSFDGFTNLS